MISSVSPEPLLISLSENILNSAISKYSLLFSSNLSIWVDLERQ